MKTYIISFILIFISLSLYAQNKYGYQWVFLAQDYLDFRYNPPKVDAIEPAPFHGIGEFGTTMSDKYGELIFQAGGCYILNKKFQIMKNGDSTNSKYTHIGWCLVDRGDGTFPLHQSAIAIPFPQKDSMYLCFNLDFERFSFSNIPTPQHLLYHVIDMRQENGLGAVIEKNKFAIDDTLTRGYLAATKHSNGVDWWIIASKFASNCYFSLKVTPDGVQTSSLSCVGMPTDSFDLGGQVTISPNSKRYVRSFYRDKIFLYDFDNTTGKLSKFTQLRGPDTASSFQAVQFSANNRYLYLSRNFKIYQFDLEALDIQASRIEVGDITNNPKIEGELHEMRLAPDGKIYIASPFFHYFLSVINRPNCSGKLCDFRPYTVQLKRGNYGGLPNIPFFEQPSANYSCDSIPSGVRDISENMTISPNPTSGIITISSTALLENYTITNITGQKVLSGKIKNTTQDIDVSTLSDGIYFIQLINNRLDTSAIGKFILKK